MKKVIKTLAVVASVCGVLFIFKDSIKEVLDALKDKISKDDFDDFDDDDDFNEDEIFGKSSDREYVNIKITDEDDDDDSDEDEEESDNEEVDE